MRRVTIWTCVVLSCAALLSLPSPVRAGVVLIDQNTSVNGLPGCPHSGFPIIICQSGSYRLTANLTISSVNTDGIDITADNVTLDLGGFTISGPVTCTPNTYPLQCTAAGSGIGISGGGPVGGSGSNNITVRNGTVQGMGNSGISIHYGNNVLVQGVHVANIGPGTCTPPIAPATCGIGIDLFNTMGIVTRCTVDTSAGDGISGGALRLLLVLSCTVETSGGNGIEGAGVVADCMVSYNGQDGILGSTNVKDTTVLSNVGFGLNGVDGYAGNILFGNARGAVSGGISLGGNLCNTTTC